VWLVLYGRLLGAFVQAFAAISMLSLMFYSQHRDPFSGLEVVGGLSQCLHVFEFIHRSTNHLLIGYICFGSVA